MMASKKKYFFGWTNIKHVLKQVYLTWSDKKSELSSKKIERSILFGVAVGSFCIWFLYHFKTLGYLEMIAATGTIFGYAGFIMVTTQKEKRLKNLEENEH